MGTAVQTAAPLTSICPSWCAVGHGATLGEEDWLHIGEPLPLAADLLARLCMSIDPDTGAVDGPYVLIGASEYSLAEATALGASLMAMASRGASPTAP